nr:VIT domain-containing protein [Kofleriaceae bacterium]
MTTISPGPASLATTAMTGNDDTVTTGSELVTTDGRSLPLVGAKLRGEAGGGIARLVLEQRFENTYGEPLTVTYRMPLPADGAVASYAFEIDGRVISGRVEPKQAARDRFERAIASGHTAALLEQQRSDIFTQEVGNIPPRATIVARIGVDMPLTWLPEGEWELRFPTVIGPRYVGTTETAEDAADTQLAVAGGEVGARVSIEMVIADALTGSASSPSHVLVGQPTKLTLRAGARLDRDIVVRWPVATRELGAALQVAQRASGGDAFGLLSIVPPAPDAKLALLPRDLILLVDTSGSMGGLPLQRAKQVAALLVESLGDADRLEMIEFSNSARRWKAQSIAVTAQVKRQAVSWLNALNAGGGTEMHGAVLDALRAMRPDAQRQVVLLSDGYIGGEQQLVRLLVEGLPMTSRLHVVGVGAAPNRTLSLAMARAGRGAEVLVGLDEDVERAAKRVVERTRAPVVTDVELSGDALLDSAPARLPDVFAGSPIVAALRLSQDGGELVVTGKLARGAYRHVVRVPRATAGAGSAAIPALYARERVADLEARAVYDSGEPIGREIEAIGVEFQIATRKTSWVAVDDSRVVTGDGPARREVMPQDLPYGTTAASFGLRAASAMPAMDGAGRAGGGAMLGYAPPMGMPAAGAPPQQARARTVMASVHRVDKREEPAAADKSRAHDIADGPTELMGDPPANAPVQPAKAAAPAPSPTMQPGAVPPGYPQQQFGQALGPTDLAALDERVRLAEQATARARRTLVLIGVALLIGLAGLAALLWWLFA